MSDLIDRQAAIDAIADFLSIAKYTSVLVSLNTGKMILARVPSAQSDLVDKIQNGIEATDADDAYSCGMRNGMRWCISLIDGEEPLYENCPSVQLDWGKPVGDGRPLADGEIIARLQDIKKQIGGSYAIERAIEVLKWLSSVQPTPCDVCRHNPPSSMGGKPCCICPAEGREE